MFSWRLKVISHTFYTRCLLFVFCWSFVWNSYWFIVSDLVCILFDLYFCLIRICRSSLISRVYDAMVLHMIRGRCLFPTIYENKANLAISINQSINPFICSEIQYTVLHWSRVHTLDRTPRKDATSANRCPWKQGYKNNKFTALVYWSRTIYRCGNTDHLALQLH